MFGACIVFTTTDTRSLQMCRLNAKMCDQCSMLPWSFQQKVTNDGFVIYCDQVRGCFAPSPGLLFLLHVSLCRPSATPSVLGNSADTPESLPARERAQQQFVFTGS